MGIDLEDAHDDGPDFHGNFWGWRALIEAIRRLEVLPDETIGNLHDQFLPHASLTREQARVVAKAIRERLLPLVGEDDRMLLDGTVTDEPDDGTFHRKNPALNYSVSRGTLLRFAEFCEKTNGFRVF